MITSVPMTASEIATALGISTTNAGDFFNVNIVNKNSKNKPVVCDTGGNTITDVQRRAADFGFSFTSWDVSASGNWNAMLDAAIAGNLGWTYNMPTTNCRLGDFYGYEHAAINQFYLASNSTASALSVTFGCYTSNAGSLKASDFGTHSYGVLWRKKGTTTCWQTENITKISDEQYTAQLAANGGYGTYEIAVYVKGFPFAKTSQAVLIPRNGLTINIVSPAPTYTLSIVGLYNGSNYQIQVNILSNSGNLLAQTMRVYLLTAASQSSYVDIQVPAITDGGSATVQSSILITPTYPAREDITSFNVHYQNTQQLFTANWRIDINIDGGGSSGGGTTPL